METYLYRRPRILILALLVIASLGAIAFQSIGRQEDPTITNLFATAITPYPGADPSRVEALVTEKIEAELREISEIDVISSVSRTGISTVQIELSDFTPDARIEQVWSEVRDALADAGRELPRGVPEPEFDNDRVGAFTMLASITAAGGAEAPIWQPSLGEDPPVAAATPSRNLHQPSRRIEMAATPIATSRGVATL